MKRWWVSWWHDPEAFGGFELHSPWWVSGGTDTADTICAALLADNEAHAMQLVYEAYDKTPSWIEFRFVEERPDDWTPWKRNDDQVLRWKRESWMQWPE